MTQPRTATARRCGAWSSRSRTSFASCRRRSTASASTRTTPGPIPPRSFPDREGEDATLPGQSAHLGNLALWYEKYGFSAKASWNFHGKYIDSVGETAAEDVYYDNHTQLDVSLSQRVTRQMRVYADFLNLTNAPLRYYLGVPNRPIQEEYYRWWAMFGVKMNF